MVQKYFKRSYEEAIKSVLPAVYFDNAVENKSSDVRLEAQLVNSLLNFCINQPSLLGVSATPGEFSSINTVSGLSKWFIPQNDRAYEVSPKTIEVDILHKLSLCTGSIIGSPCTFARDASAVDVFTLSGDSYNKFLTFFKKDLLPKIVLNSNSLAETTASAFSNTASGTHDYLIDKLGWLYFLNTSGTDYDPSAYVASALTDIYLSSTPYTTQDGVKGIFDYIWRNWSSLSSTSSGILPINYYSGTGQYVSGTQNLDKLKTLIEVVYDKGAITLDDTYIYDAFIDYINNGNLVEDRESTGQFTKFIKGTSYAMFDTNKNSQLLEYLYDLEKCPDKYLKYLAELIGWNLRGSSPAGWRRQLRFAMKLYKQKGTKEGLYNAITTILPGTQFQSSSISEFYESYVPNLIYYLLKTAGTEFDSWSPDKASFYADGEFSYSDTDLNVRFVMDHMFLKAVKLFPEQFYVRNFKFDIDNPEFIFEYRGRGFSIPPWEEVKFYRDVDLTIELLNFFKDQLLCFGVPRKLADSFFNYVKDHVLSDSLSAKFYNNSLLFFTSSLNIAPNESDILDNQEFEKYEYLSLWNAKSSHFDVSLSSGSFDTGFFNDILYTKNDFFQSLSIVDDFTPAKSIARSHVDLEHVDGIVVSAVNCPSVRYAVHDLVLSGVQGGYQSSGVDIRSIQGAVGGDYSTPANSSRSANDHTNLPVFKREVVDNSYDPIQLAGSSVSAAPLTNVERSNIRRRDFSKTLKKSGWYTRTGQNMPIYYNTSDQGDTDIDYYPLGFINSQYGFNPVINFKNLYEVSSWPYDTDVWSNCWDSSSDYTLSTIAASSTFDVRGRQSITPGTCNSYVNRDRLSDFNYYLYNLRYKKAKGKAEAIYKTNKILLDVSSFRDPIASLTEVLLDEEPLQLQSLYSTTLGKRIFSRDSIDGVHKSFKDYIAYFTDTGIGNGLLDSYTDGGPNILSHTYGPILYNAYFNIEGSATSVSSNLIETAATQSFFTVSSLSALNNLSANSVDDMYVEYTEVRNPYVLSGVELVDAVTGTSEFTIYDLDTSNASTQRDNYNIENSMIFLKSKSSFPRIRFNLKDYGTSPNFLIPERDFKLTVRGNFGRDDSLLLGGGSFGVWIHTDVETDYNGNKVFWNYMPDGTWVKYDASILQAQGAVNFVKYTLSHSLDFQELTNADAVDSCFTTKVIQVLQEKDVREKSLTFDTRNQKVKVPYSYYKKQNQVHRTSQNYVVELFQYDNTFSNTFAIIDHISVQDMRQYSRTFTKHPIQFNDYSKYSDLLETYKFYDEEGKQVSGVDIILDSSGNMTTADGSKVTFHVAEDLNSEYKTQGILYSQVTTTFPERWFKDVQGNVINLKSEPYNGIIQIDASSNITPSSITIVGKTKGSNILKKETLFIPLEAEELLIILREFKRLLADEGARNKAISASEYGAEGGSRLNYKFAPMWLQTGGYSEFESNARQYTEIYLEN